MGGFYRIGLMHNTRGITQSRNTPTTGSHNDAEQETRSTGYWYLLGANPSSTTTTTATLSPTATEATATPTTPHVTVYRGTATRSADWALTSLFTSLDHNTHLLALPNVNANTALTTLHGRKGGDDGTARGFNGGKFEECTRFAPNDVKIFDGSETAGQGTPQSHLGNILLYAL